MSYKYLGLTLITYGDIQKGVVTFFFLDLTVLSCQKNGTVQSGGEKTRFLAKLMKLQCSITLFLFTPRKHKGYESISKFDELFEKQHHLSKLLN